MDKETKEIYLKEAIDRLHAALDKWADDAQNHGDLTEEQAEKLANIAAGRFGRGRF